MTQAKLPPFIGRPFVDGSQSIPTINFLDGEFGKSVLKEFAGRTKRDYLDAPALKEAFYYDEGGVLRGSNTYATVLVGKILREANTRTRVATLRDMESAIEWGALPLGEYYQNVALVLREDYGASFGLAKRIAKELDRRKIARPVMIPLNGLDLEKDASLREGLAFVLREDAEIIPAVQLEATNHGRKFTKADAFGLPIFAEDGTRTLYASERNLCSCCLLSNFSLDTGYCPSDCSEKDGRIVVVDSGACAIRAMDVARTEPAEKVAHVPKSAALEFIAQTQDKPSSR